MFLSYQTFLFALETINNSFYFTEPDGGVKSLIQNYHHISVVPTLLSHPFP